MVQTLFAVSLEDSTSMFFYFYFCLFVFQYFNNLLRKVIIIRMDCRLWKPKPMEWYNTKKKKKWSLWWSKDLENFKIIFSMKNKYLLCVYIYMWVYIYIQGKATHHKNINIYIFFELFKKNRTAITIKEVEMKDSTVVHWNITVTSVLKSYL